MSFIKNTPQILASDPSGAGPAGGLAVSQSSGDLFYVNALTQDWNSITSGGGGGPTLNGNNTFTGKNVFQKDPLVLGANAISAILGGFYAAIAISGDSVFYDVFHDESTFTSTTTGGLASFDSNPQINGATAYNHFNAFQDRAIYNGTGSMGSWASYNAQPVISNSGVITNLYGLHITAPTVSGGGTITNSYGVRQSSSPTVTGAKYFLYQDVTDTPNFLGSSLQVSGETIFGGQCLIGPSNASPGSALTLSVLDRTATTGATNVYVGWDNNGHTSATGTTLYLVGGATGNRQLVIKNNSLTDVAAWFSTTTAIKTGYGLPCYFGDGTLSSSTESSSVIMMDVAGVKVALRSTGVVGFSSSSSSAKTAIDTGISRISAGLMAVGNGTSADFSGSLKCTDVFTNDAGFLIRAVTALTGGGTGNVPTLTTGPVTGNPTKWIPIDDAGTTRYVPAW